MSKEYSINDKIYPGGDDILLSIADMLAYFEKHGAMRVSDLHIKISTPPAYRIDGDLIRMKGAPITKEIAEGLIYPLIGENGIEELKKNKAVDCSYITANLQYRINAFIDNDGLSAAIRALGTDIPQPENVGFPSDVWKDLVKLKHGLVLFTGITGAGKSTTIASLIERINQTRPCRVITLEDPIEYLFDQQNAMISQREVGRDVSSFSDGLRSMMREDPDIIFVGEM